MKRVLTFLCAVALCAFAFTPQLAQGQVGNRSKLRKVNKAIPNQYIVVLREDTPKAGVAALANHLAHAHGGNLRHVYQHAIKGFSLQITEAAARALSQNPQVEFIEEDGETSIVATQPNATFGLDRIDQRSLALNNTYIYSHTGAGVNAYVIDTGIRPTHQEFGGRASAAYDAVGGNGIDCNGHGTHVAGTIGGSTYGVAKQVNIYGVRVFGCGSTGSVSDAVEGVDWVTGNHVSPAVANMSLAVVGGSDMLDFAVRQSIAVGVTYVIAAGNDNVNAGSYSPARVTEGLTVGATDSSDTRAQFGSGFGSNFGAVLDLFAPGKFITSAWYDSDVSTNTISGTSMAAPHVAGVAALYLQSNPGASPATVNQAIINNATPGKVIDPGPDSPNRLLYSIFNSAHDNRADFDGDYRTNISVYKQNMGTNQWSFHYLSNGQTLSFQFGQTGDIPTPGDYNGDGKTDYAVFRPENGTGTWYIATDTNVGFYGVQFGLSTDIPVARDYDGDGKTDIAVFRPSEGNWYRLNSSNNAFQAVHWGQNGDRPVPGDYDGDARADLAVFRPSTSTWYILWANYTFKAVQFGVSSDIPVQADYDGDDLTDIAVFRPNEGNWYWLNSSDNAFQGAHWGQDGDRPVPGDYDGDGKADLAVQRPDAGATSTWYILKSSTGSFDSVNFDSGFPVPGGYVSPLY
jgi:subtilisin family serine protease